MSLNSWKREFYPVPAGECPKTTHDAIVHSLQKWEGLKPENLAKHGLEKVGLYVSSLTAKNSRLRIDTKSCALCVRHYADSSCVCCPLALVRNGVPCDEMTPAEQGGLDPWNAWASGSNPEPMLMWLRKAADANTPI